MDEDFHSPTLLSVHHKTVSMVKGTACKTPVTISEVPKPLHNLISVPIKFRNGEHTPKIYISK